MKNAILVLLMAIATMAFAACGNSNEPGQEAGGQNRDTVVAAANFGDLVAATPSELQAAPGSQPEHELDADIAPAFANLGSEVAHRLNATPLNVFSLLADSLRNGTTNIDVRHGGPFGIRLEANLATNSQTRENHTQLGVNYMGFVRVDAEFFATPDSLAIRVPIFDNNFYGVTFSTLEDDVTAFLNNIGIEPGDFTPIFEGLNMFLGDDGLEVDSLDSLEIFQPYIDAFLQFISEFDFAAQDTEHAGVSVTRYEYSFTMQELFDFVEALFYLITADTAMLLYLEMFDIALFDVVDIFNDIMDAILSDAARTPRDLLNSNVVMAFYVCQNDRLMYFELQTYMQYVRTQTSVQTNIGVDFGISVYCDWVLSVNTDTIVWSFSNMDNTYTNIITATILDSWTNRYATTIASSVWSTTTGDFAMSLLDEFGTDTALYGQFTRDANGNFTLRFSEDELDVVITGTPVTPNIPQANIINIDQWDMELVEDVLSFVFELMMLME